jgi:hypothetical protein
MLALRFYIDKTDGGEHSRVLDVGELDEQAAREKVEGLLGDGEEINQVVSVTLNPATDEVI